MSSKIFIGVAWPYANGSLHLGHIAGCYLPADIFARFHRLKGDDVLMVSGSDEHGTPITITADNEKTTPQEIVDRYHQEHKENMRQFGISFDLFTRTTTKNHEQVVQEIFTILYTKKYIYKSTIQAYYCERCHRFLPDRYIEGICPCCHREGARGDQCDHCGKLLECFELDQVKCKLCGTPPVIRSTEHFFFALSKFESPLLQYIQGNTHWRANVLRFTENWLKGGLKDRAITRDITWGIPVPLPGFEEKRIYVWFDAVIGYLSASKEWACAQGKKDLWEMWWKNTNCKHYYFLAKDNIPFHSIIWPSILMGYDHHLNLPYDIPANEYLLLKGEQFSKSRKIAIWVPDILQKVDPDAVRYYLSINMPENKDTNWLWNDFIAKNNDELVGTYGNFVHRVLTFINKNFGVLRKPETFTSADKEALKKIQETSQEVSDAISHCMFKKGLRSAMNLAQYGNVYFDQNQPWILVKKDTERCNTVLYVCLKIIQALAVFTAPYLPFGSHTIWNSIGFTKPISRWDDAFSELPENKHIDKPLPVFKKLELSMIVETTDPFSKVDLRVAKIEHVQDHPKADKLYILSIDIGPLGKRTIVAGIKPYYSKDELQGKKIVIVNNLKPATIRGIESKGMLLAAGDDIGTVVLLNPGDAYPGAEILVEGIPHEPVSVLEFDDFKSIQMTTNDNDEIVYNGKPLKIKNITVKTDKKIKPGSQVR
ncbi:MAG: methionine--tRNA ligase [Candidatus Thermoplasmatota archaeon]